MKSVFIHIPDCRTLVPYPETRTQVAQYLRRDRNSASIAILKPGKVWLWYTDSQMNGMYFNLLIDGEEEEAQWEKVWKRSQARFYP